MKKDFDHIAKFYDQDFTHSKIGKYQRKSVYFYLEKFFSLQKNINFNVLELNCGTGEDAIWLAKKSHTVLATDISNEMITVAKNKGKGIDNLKFKQLDINNLDVILSEVDKSQKFDTIFSNFGGLNCLNKEELNTFLISTKSVLTPNGKLILVIMPKNTLWERLYFILKLDFKKAFRRNTDKALKVNVENKKVTTWYYNPKDIKEIAKPYFKTIKTRPIGFFIPPSYLEPFFTKKKRLLSILNILEKSIRKFGFLSRFSDHYLIELEFKVRT